MTRVRTTSGHHGPATPSPVRGGRGRARRGRPARFRGLTLLELLLGITILAALGGLVFASVRPLREDARLRTARDRIDTVVREARELAMRFGEPVAVVFDPAAARVEATSVDGFSDVGAAGPEAAKVGTAADAAIRPSIDLDPRLRLSMRPPAADDGWADPDVGSEAAGLEPWAGGELEPWPVAVFLPDGTMLMSRTAWLHPAEAEEADAIDAGADAPVAARWRLSIHPWTGEPIWVDEAAARVGDAEFGAADEQFEPFDEFDQFDAAGGGDAADAFDDPEVSGAPGRRPASGASPPEFGP